MNIVPQCDDDVNPFRLVVPIVTLDASHDPCVVMDPVRGPRHLVDQGRGRDDEYDHQTPGK